MKNAKTYVMVDDATKMLVKDVTSYLLFGEK